MRCADGVASLDGGKLPSESMRPRSDRPFRAYVHLGFPKCASTSLQSVLAHTKKVYYLGKGGGTFAEDVRKKSRGSSGVALTRAAERYRSTDIGWVVRREIPAMPDISYDRGMVADVLGGAVAEARSLGRDALHLSDEVLSGIGLSLYRMNRVSIGTIAQRLAEGLDVPVSFVAITRAQPEMLWSYYRKLLLSGYHLTFTGFLDDVCGLPTRDEAGARAALGIVAGLMYDRVVEDVSRHGDVVIVPFEDVVSGQAGADRLLTAMGLQPGTTLPHFNKGVEDPELELVENLMDPSGLAARVPSGLVSADARRRRRWEREPDTKPKNWRSAVPPELIEVFARSNARTVELTGLDLGALGYPLPTT